MSIHPLSLDVCVYWSSNAHVWTNGSDLYAVSQTRIYQAWLIDHCPGTSKEKKCLYLPRSLAIGCSVRCTHRWQRQYWFALFRQARGRIFCSQWTSILSSLVINRIGRNNKRSDQKRLTDWQVDLPWHWCRHLYVDRLTRQSNRSSAEKMESISFKATRWK